MKFAHLLVYWNEVTDASYYQRIRHLMSSHAFRVTREHTKLQRYWTYESIGIQRGLKPEAYAEDLFAKLNQAVTARLRSYKPVAATLSGGMDSSTVCMLAQARVFSLDKEALRLSFNTALGCETGLELRDPTADPRVIESAFSIPNELYFGSMDKWVLRTMMNGRLPDTVRMNAKKGQQSADFIPRLYMHRKELDAAFSAMKASGIGRILDTEQTAADWEALKASPETYSYRKATRILLHIAVFELYRTLDAPAQESLCLP